MERLSATLGEMEIKQSMLLMNESLRTKEELAGIRAAINGIRMQIHWLLTVRVHGTEQRYVIGSGGGGGGGTQANSSGQSRAVDDTASKRLSGELILLRGMQDSALTLCSRFLWPRCKIVALFVPSAALGFCGVGRLVFFHVNIG